MFITANLFKAVTSSFKSAESLRQWVLVFVLFFSGCSPAPDPPLRVGAIIWPGYESLFLARTLGYYDNTSIKLVELITSQDVLHALRNGNLEAAALTLDETLTLLADGLDLKVVVIFDYSNGGDVLLVKPGITSLEQLRGKRIALEYTTVGAVLLDSVLEAANLETSDIEIVSCSLTQHLNCYPMVDAIVTFDPNRTQLINEGAKVLFDSSQIPGRIMDVLVVREEVVEVHRDALRQLVLGYFRALDYLVEHPQDAAQKMTPRMGLTPAELLDSYGGLHLPDLMENKSLLRDSPEEFQNNAHVLAEFMQENDLVRNAPVFNGNLGDGEFLPESLQ